MNSAAVISFEKMSQTSPPARTPFPSLNFEFDGADAKPVRPEIPKAVPADSAAAAIEAMPHLNRQIVRLWGTRELGTLLYKLLLDSRDGSRQGFPHEVARELMFLAKLNVVVRGHDAAPLLGVSVGEACRLIEAGDHAALGHATAAEDIWGVNHALRDKAAGGARRQAGQHGTVAFHHGRHGHPPPHPPLPELPLSPELTEAPPMPPSVCLDLTTTRTLRHGRPAPDQPDDGEVMAQSFFRCIAKELGSLKIPQLVLSDLSEQQRCAWLPSAVAFAKKHCHFKKVVLHADLLSADEAQLVQAMAAGLNHLVINCNLASGKWRRKAETIAEGDPDHFGRQVRRLIQARDQVFTQNGPRCAISVVLVNHKSVYHLSHAFVELSREAGLTPFRHVADGRRQENTGPCHCWSPFIEAQVRTNGHLVACAQDHTGYSFTADLKQTTFSDAWLGQAFKNIRLRTLHGDKPGRMCEICPHRIAPEAGGGIRQTR